MNIIEVQNSLQNLINTKISLAEIGNILGVTRASISKRAKLGRDMKREELQIIGKHYGVNLMPNSLVIQNGAKDENIELDYFPDVFGSCGNGVFQFSTKKELITIPKSSLFQHFNPAKQYFVINAYGNSMEPFICDKDKLVVESYDGEQIIDNRPYLFAYKDEIFVKRLAKNVDQLMIIPENKDFDVRKLTGKQLEDVNIIGQIVGLMRDFR